MLMLAKPASGTATACGPRSNADGRDVYSRPIQLPPWLLCSSWGPVPVFSITTSTASRTRRTFSSIAAGFTTRTGPGLFGNSGTRGGKASCARAAGPPRGISTIGPNAAATPQRLTMPLV